VLRGRQLTIQTEAQRTYLFAGVEKEITASRGLPFAAIETTADYDFGYEKIAQRSCWHRLLTLFPEFADSALSH
jgi:hypothetical protein